MMQLKKTLLLSLMSIAFAASSAYAQVNFGANIELDNTYNSKVTNATNARKSDYDMGGRLELNITGKATKGDYFVEGKATGLLKTNGDTAVDDMWLALGNNFANIKLGRFEAMDLFPMGQDTVVDLDNLYTGYRANLLRGRFGSDGNRSAHAALTVNASNEVKLELGLVASQSCDAAQLLRNACKSVVKSGVRPVLQYMSGPWTFRVGAESFRNQGQSGSKSGFGVTGAYNYGAGTVNVSAAKSDDDKSIGINGTYGGLGLGYIHSKGQTSALQSNAVYASYKASLFGIKGAYITPAISVAKGGSGSKRQTAARLRLNYEF